MESIKNQIINYIKGKKYNVFDITNNINPQTYLKYVFLANEQPNNVFIFEKTKINTFIFTAVNATKECNYYFLNKNNYMFAHIDKSLTDDNKRCLNGFLDTTTDMLECMICCKETNKLSCCTKCYYKVCMICLGDLLKHNSGVKVENNLIHLGKCPQCRQEMTPFGTKTS